MITRPKVDPALTWLLGSPDPTVRYFTLVDLLEESPDSVKARHLRAQIPAGPRVRALLTGQGRDGGFGVHPYKKWNGAHWRLVSLVELGLPAGHPQAVAAAEQVLRWLTGPTHRSGIVTINDLVRRCASQEGNALAVCSLMGLADDPRVRSLAHDLVSWQWPDGGWNCDKRRAAHHSSFHESLIPLWGLIEYRKATGDASVSVAMEAAAEFFLRHRLFRSERDGTAIVSRGVDGRHRVGGSETASEFMWLRYPAYWHYNILQALRVMALLGRLGDPRVQEALDIIERNRRSDGTWAAEGYWWYPPGQARSNVEVVDWGRRGPNEMITLRALQVLKAGGRL